MRTPTSGEAERAVATLLAYIGDDPTRPGLQDTPGRVVRALAEMTDGMHVDPSAHLATTFPDRCDEMVVVTGLDFVSLCEHHLLPFTGTAVVGYVPGEQVAGLSKFARVLDGYAHRPQVQERLTQQVADAMDQRLHPAGCGVVLTAHHECMSCRGVRKAGARMVTSALRGNFRTDPAVRAEFLALAR